MPDSDPDDPVLLTEDAGGVRLITLNRPDRLNAFDQRLFTAFAGALEGAGVDDGIRVVVVTGAGRAFTSGADLADMARAEGPSADAPARRANPFVRLQQAAETFPKPLIAAVNGVGVGLGFTFLGYCDMAYIAESARLRTPFTALGLVPEASSSYLFPLRMGWQRAARALLAGEWFDAAQVVEAGMALAVCPDGEVVDVALGAARTLAQAPLESLVATKALMLAAHADAVSNARRLETRAMGKLVGGAANAEALARFARRRS